MVNDFRISRAHRAAMKAEHEREDREDFGILLGLAFNAFATELRAFLAEAGFEKVPKSFGYVARNIRGAHLTLTELAERLAMTSPGALKIVQEMESTGYLERFADPADGRVKRHRLTKRGESALRAARSFHEDFEAGLAKRVGKQKAKALREALVDLVRSHEQSQKPLVIRPM